MGTTYQAQVEVWFDALPQYSMIGQWQEVSRWELQKDYTFGMAWDDASEDGWPEDVNLIGEPPRGKWPYDFDRKRHGDGAMLLLLELEKPSSWVLGLQTHVRDLIAQGYKTRVLTWGE